MLIPKTLISIDNELARAIDKFPKWPEDLFRAQSIIAEEAGEIAKAVNDGNIEEAIIEAVQCAAMCIRFIEGIKKPKSEIPL